MKTKTQFLIELYYFTLLYSKLFKIYHFGLIESKFKNEFF